MNARVLPDPVSDIPIKSFPLRAIDQPSNFILIIIGIYSKPIWVKVL
jgi:hypothetical protein